MSIRHMIDRRGPAIGLALLLLATWCAYLPGLSGDFLFDDFVNLDKLASPGPIDNAAAFWRYITSGIADPTGRPLSMLSFLLDARHWPADPAPFLRTNLLLHLLNGALLFVLLRRLGRALDGNEASVDPAALLGAGLWLLHPLFVSTTLYIVQREAMLPATFTLLGLLAYLHGRARLPHAPRAGLAWMLLGIGGGTALAMLCKANGILLPLFAWILEAVVLRHGATTSTVRIPAWFHRGMLVLPSALVFAYLALHLRDIAEPIGHRAWTIGERLLTEPRVLVEYLRLIIVPRVLSTGVYNDGYVASRGLLDPSTTLFALMVVVGLVAAAFALPRRAPALSAALLFFFAGHLLESTVIPLELYFEHRNYLPAMLLFWPVGRALFRWRAPSGVRPAIAIVLLAICAAITWQRAELWGKPDRMAMLWAAQSPASSRAQATAASFEIRAGRPDAALARLAPLWLQHPHDLQLALNHANAACATGGLSPDDAASIAEAFAHASEGDQLIHRWLSRAIGTAREGSCPGLTAATIDRWIAGAWRNPKVAAIAGRRQDLHSLSGRVALLHGRPDAALLAFDRALEAEPSADAAGMQASLLAAAGAYRQALSHLDRYEALRATQTPPKGWHMRHVHAWVLERQSYWPYELGLLRKKLLEEIAKEESAKDDGPSVGPKR